MRIQIIAAGALTNSLPSGRDIVEGEDLTVRGVLQALLDKHGAPLKAELMHHENLREGLALLVNGRNVLSLPFQFETSLQEEDAVLITIVTGGG